MKILVTGDLVITDNYEGKKLIGSSLKKFFSESDYRIVNLEAPVTENNPKNKILKTGPHLRSNGKSVLPTLKKLNINLVTLANNHILDFGENGLNDTLEFCKSNKIDWTGVGKNKTLANTAKRIELSETKISIINFAENEWASATEKTAGANPMDLIENVKLIHQEKEFSDFVFVIVHGGHEYYNLPSPQMQKQYRFYVDNGADIVVGHHTHCISGFEIYKKAPIYYSLGNFLFTIPSNYEGWYQGIALEIIIDQNNNLTTSVKFVEQDKKDFSLSFVKGDQLKKLEQIFNNYSSTIISEKNIQEKWLEYINKKSGSYLKIWSPYTFVDSRYVKSILYRLGIKFRNKKAQAKYLNHMRCESHTELSKAVIENELKKP